MSLLPGTAAALILGTGRVRGQGVNNDVTWAKLIVYLATWESVLTEMSRIIVKHLPGKVTEKRVQEIFGRCGEVTDVKLMKSREGIFRRFGFVGFSSDAAAEEAVKYFNNTFIDSSKIAVEIAKPYLDVTIPRPWSKHSKGSSSYQKREGGRAVEDESDSSEVKPEKEVAKSRLNQLLETYAELEGDVKFQEFVALHKPKVKAQTWLDDGVGGLSTPHSVKGGGQRKNNLDTEPSLKEEAKEEKEEEEEEGEEVNSLKEAATPHVSDLDYLFSKVVRQKPSTDNLQSHDTLDTKDLSDPNPHESESGDPNPHGSESGDPNPHGSESGDPNLHESEIVGSNRSDTRSVASTPYTLKMRGLPFKAKEADIRTFFHPLAVVAVRFTTDPQGRPSGRAYVDFNSELDMQQALKHNGDCINWRYIELFKDEGPLKKSSEEDRPPCRPWEMKPVSVEDESIAESGRLFLRNLPYTTTEDDLTKLLEPFGPLTEALVCLDKETNRSVGLAFVTFMLPEHAVKAYEALDGSIFQGRLLHILPAKPRATHEEEGDTKTAGSSFKRKREREIKAQAGSAHNWNTLFLGANAVADAMVERFGTDKSTLLSTETDHSVAVRMALGETQLVSETREFMETHGVNLNLFGQENVERSKTVIVAKNLPFGTASAELQSLFSPFGPLKDVILPPSGISGLVVFLEPPHAREAFRKLAYTKFKHVPLYLEWAPMGVIDQKLLDKKTKEQTDGTGTGDGLCTVFVKNLNFSTTDKALQGHFANIGEVVTAVVARKHNTHDPAHPLSTGFGFVQFTSHQQAMKAIKELQHSTLDEHQIELKVSHKQIQGQSTGGREKTKALEQKSAKIMVRNVPFEASKKEIMELFRAFGEVKTVRLPKKFGGQSEHRGFAFVEFLTKEEAKRAFDSLCHSTHLYGRRLVLEWAEEEESVDAIRKRTLEHFSASGERLSKKRKGEELLFCLADE